jgi:hypothetical protein
MIPVYPRASTATKCTTCGMCRYGLKYPFADDLMMCEHPKKYDSGEYIPMFSEHWTCEYAEEKDSK